MQAYIAKIKSQLNIQEKNRDENLGCNVLDYSYSMQKRYSQHFGPSG